MTAIAWPHTTTETSERDQRGGARARGTGKKLRGEGVSYTLGSRARFAACLEPREQARPAACRHALDDHVGVFWHGHVVVVVHFDTQRWPSARPQHTPSFVVGPVWAAVVVGVPRGRHKSGRTRSWSVKRVSTLVWTYTTWAHATTLFQTA